MDRPSRQVSRVLARRSTPALLEVGQDLPCRVRAGRAGDPSAGVRPGSAEIEAGDRHSVAREPQQRAPGEELIQAGLAVKHMPPGKSEIELEVDGSQDLSGNDEVREPRRV